MKRRLIPARSVWEWEASSKSLPEVQEVHFMAGDFYYLIKVREKDPEAHVSLVRKLGRLGVRDCQTLLILQTVKDTSAIPVYEKDAEK